MNVFELSGDDDNADATTTPNAITGRSALLTAALQQPQFADLTELVTAGPAQFVLITAPSTRWAQALTRHLQTESPPVHARSISNSRRTAIAAWRPNWLSSLPPAATSSW